MESSHPSRSAGLVLATLVALLAACQSNALAPPSPSVGTTPPALVSASPAAAPLTETPLSPTTVAAAASANSPDPGWDDRSLFRQGLVAGEQGALEGLPGATVYHIDLEIPPELDRLTGRQSVRYTNRENEPLSEVYFRLYPNLAGGAARLSAVQVDGQSVEPVYELEKSAVRVALPSPLQPGQDAVFDMDFQVDVPREMGGNYGLFGYFEDVLVLDEFYPVIPAYDDEGWNVEIPSRNGDVTHFDASFYLVRVTAPATLTLVASGVEVGRERLGERQVLTFAAGPARDFYLAASQAFTSVSARVGDTQVHSYAFAERGEAAERALQHAVDALNVFNARLGPYPYTEFELASTPMRAQGIEYPGVVGLSLALYDPAQVVGGLPSRVILEAAVAHEVAHQWIYNVVGNDQVDEPWLDEALAQYLTMLYYADVYGEEGARAFRSALMGRWDRVDRADIPIGMPTGSYEGAEYAAIVYGRGPLFVETLAEKMGQEKFEQFLRGYYAVHKWGIATRDSFQQLAEAACECDLAPLFEAWVDAR